MGEHHHRCWNDNGTSLFRALERVREQQTIFVRKVQEEMEALSQRGVRREEAVEMLLKRIRSLRADAPMPSEAEVSLVMRNHGLSRDDAVRALVVSNVMVNFRREGWDSASAIEELTKHLTSHTLLSSTLPPPPSSHTATTPTSTITANITSASLRKRPLATVSADSESTSSCPAGGGGGVKMDMYGRTRSKTKAGTDVENAGKHMINKGTEVSRSPRKKGGARGGEPGGKGGAPQKRSRGGAEAMCDLSGPQGALMEATIKRSRNE